MTQTNINREYSRHVCGTKIACLNIIHFIFTFNQLSNRCFVTPCQAVSPKLIFTGFLSALVYIRMCAYTSHLYEVSCFRYDMVPDGSLRAAYETHVREVRCRHSREARAETVNPETRDRGAGAPVFFHRATNSALAASRMSLATALAEPLGETDRENDPFFSSRIRGTSVFFSAIGAVSSPISSSIPL